METRTLAIGFVAIVAAFAAAFGVAKSGGSETETAGAGVKAQSIQVAAPAAVSGVEVGGTLPALKAERKAKKKNQPASNSNSNASEPQTSDSPDSAAPDTSTQPSNPQPSNPQPSNPQPSNPQPSNPKPSTPKSNDPPPVSSGGDDG